MLVALNAALGCIYRAAAPIAPYAAGQYAEVEMEGLRKEYTLELTKKVFCCVVQAKNGSDLIRLMRDNLGSVPLKDIVSVLETLGIEKLDELFSKEGNND